MSALGASAGGAAGEPWRSIADSALSEAGRWCYMSGRGPSIVPSRARIIAFLAALLMTLPTGAWARSRYFCRSMDRVMDACCCGGLRRVEPLPRSVSQGAELRAGDCCERLEQPSLKAATGARDGAQHVPAPPALAVLATPAPPVLPSGWILQRERPHSRAPPLVAVPLYLRHCAFLS